MWTARAAVVVLVALAPLGVADAQGASPELVAPPPLQSSLVSVGRSALPYIPANAQGYRLTDSVKLGKPSGGMQYVYKHHNDVANVSVIPYGADRPVSHEDTLVLVKREAELVRRPIQDAAGQRELLNYALYFDRVDVLRVGGRSVNLYRYFVGIQRRGESAVFLYYGVYAIPYGLVLVRGELPWTAAPSSSAMGTHSARPATAANLSALGADASVRPPNTSFSTVGADAAHATLSAFSNTVVAEMVTHVPPAAEVAVGPVPSTGAAPAATVAAVCAAMPPATDTIRYRVYATLEAPARRDTLPAAYVGFVLDAVRRGLVVPNPLGLTVYAATVSGGDGLMVPAVYGEIAFMLDEQGKVSDVHLTQSSLSPALDRSFFDAPRRADSMQSFPAELGVANPGPIQFFVSFLPFDSHSGKSMAVFAARMPAWRPGTRPAVDPAHDIHPGFPSTAPNAEVGDSVAIQFVVDEHGAPVEGTIRLLGATHLEYAQAVVDAALHSQYIPANAVGCPVKGLLERSWRMRVGAQ